MRPQPAPPARPVEAPEDAARVEVQRAVLQQHLRRVERQESPGHRPGVQQPRHQPRAVARDDHHRVLAGGGGDRRGRGPRRRRRRLDRRVRPVEHRRQIEEPPDPVHAPFVQRAQRHLGGVGAPARRPHRPSRTRSSTNGRPSPAVGQQRLQAAVERRVVQVLGDHHRRAVGGQQRPQRLELVEAARTRAFRSGGACRRPSAASTRRRCARGGTPITMRLVAPIESPLRSCRSNPAPPARAPKARARSGSRLATPMRRSRAQPLERPDVAGVHGAAAEKADRERPVIRGLESARVRQLDPSATPAWRAQNILFHPQPPAGGARGTDPRAHQPAAAALRAGALRLSRR